MTHPENPHVTKSATDSRGRYGEFDWQHARRIGEVLLVMGSLYSVLFVMMFLPH